LKRLDLPTFGRPTMTTWGTPMGIGGSKRGCRFQPQSCDSLAPARRTRSVSFSLADYDN
jgi:hypothetical protein